MKLTHLLYVAIASATVLLSAGCNSKSGRVESGPNDSHFFAPEEGDSATTIYQAQAARGTRADGTLYTCHFDRGSLNSLGRNKLDLMLADADTAYPVQVYLDLRPGDAAANALADSRRSAVEHYLSDRGLQAAQFKLEAGANPSTLHPAAAAVNGLSKLDNAPATERHEGGITVHTDQPNQGGSPVTSEPAGPGSDIK